jgi:hypothetical protein
MGREDGKVLRGPNRATNMKETIAMTRSTDMACSCGPVEIRTKGSTKTTSAMAMGRCVGLITVYTRANGSGGFRTDMERCSFQTVSSRKGNLSLMYTRDLEKRRLHIKINKVGVKWYNKVNQQHQGHHNNRTKHVAIIM